MSPSIKKRFKIQTPNDYRRNLGQGFHQANSRLEPVNVTGIRTGLNRSSRMSSESNDSVSSLLEEGSHAIHNDLEGVEVSGDDAYQGIPRDEIRGLCGISN